MTDLEYESAPQPDYTDFRITELWAFVAVDPKDGEEGVMAGPVGTYPLMPLIAADQVRLDQLRPIAEQLGRFAGVKVKLIRVTNREDVEVVYDPESAS